MNDFERKLRDTPLRPPPAEWRAEILAALPNHQPAASRWHEWLWPPPLAWGTLAAIWIVLCAIEFSLGTASVKPGPHPAFKMPAPESLLMLRKEQALALMR